MNSSVQLALEVSKAWNTSGNGTPPLESCVIASPIVPREVNIIVHFLAFFTSLTGNTLLIIAYLRMNEAILLLIANMAASDLLLALVLFPRWIIIEVTESSEFLVRGSGGAFLCKICTVLSDASLSVSTQSLILIAVERLLALIAPVLYRRITNKKRRILVICTWIVAILLHLPYFYVMQLVLVPHKGTFIQVCDHDWKTLFEDKTAHVRYSIFLFTTVLVIPILIICVLYAVIIITQRNDKMDSSRSEKSARRREQRVKKLQRMAVATVTALFLCWPLYVMIVLHRIVSPETVPKCSKFYKVVDHISHMIASCYCAVNPCLCFVFIKNFSRQLSFLCKRKSNRQPLVKKVIVRMSEGENLVLSAF